VAAGFSRAKVAGNQAAKQDWEQAVQAVRQANDVVKQSPPTVSSGLESSCGSHFPNVADFAVATLIE
jgi:hypothetical protein